MPETFELCPDYVFDLSAADVPAAEKPSKSPDATRDKDHVIVGVPEHTHPGESASNGKAESAVRILVGQARTLKVELEARLGLSNPPPCGHPIASWIFNHAAWVLSKYGLNPDGRTPRGDCKTEVCEIL